MENEARILELLGEKPAAENKTQRIIQNALETYCQANTAQLRLILLAERMSEVMEKLENHLPQAPEYVLYAYLRQKGFQPSELQELNVQGCEVPTALNAFFSEALNPTKDLSFLLAIEKQKGFVHFEGQSYSFSILNNYLIWNGKRHRWQKPENEIKISPKHYKRLVTNFFPAKSAYNFKIENNKLYLRDQLTESNFHIQWSSLSQPKTKFPENDLKKLRDLQALTAWLRQENISAVEMLVRIEEEKAAHPYLHYRLMPRRFIECIQNWPHVHRSPFSFSFYNMEGKSWTETPENIIRISDHWNFESHGQLHGKTDRAVPKGHWAAARYSGRQQQYLVQEILPAETSRMDHFDRLYRRAHLLRNFIKP